jgi:lipid-binding SYLF domain-containing protein
MNKPNRAVFVLILVSVLASTGLVRVAAAASAAEIDTKVDGALAQFSKEVPGGGEFLDKASGVLVFPGVVKAGLVVGGEYGNGALRIDGKSVQYYNIASASFGLQIGAQEYAIVMVFLSNEALQKFRDSKGWEAGVDGSVAIAQWGAGKDINTQNFKEPIVGFVFSNKGLMAGVSIEGSKITKLTNIDK